MKTEATKTPATLTADEAMTFLHPAPGRNLLRVRISGASEAVTNEEYFRYHNSKWRRVGQEAPGRESGLQELIAENVWAHHVRAGVHLVVAPSASEISPVVTSIAVAFPVPLVQRADDVVDGTLPGGYSALARIQRAARTPNRIDVAGVAAVMTRLEGLGPMRPSLIVHEGDRVLGIWRLAEPIHEAGAASFDFLRMTSGRVGHRVSIRLGADCRFSDEPHHQLVEVPGTIRQDIAPAFTVFAQVFHEERVTLESLERLGAGG